MLHLKSIIPIMRANIDFNIHLCSIFWGLHKKPSDDIVFLAFAHTIKKIELVQKSETDDLPFLKTTNWVYATSLITGAQNIFATMSGFLKTITFDNVAAAVFQRSVVQSLLFGVGMCPHH